MLITQEQSEMFAYYILKDDIIKYCIDNYQEFNKFQLDGNEPIIFTKKEYLDYQRMEMTLL
ncbi:MAG: hypothetical protein PHD02_04975 [Bacilli bacterium]|nr:hypothetical protein [Bacilli bacterium]